MICKRINLLVPREIVNIMSKNDHLRNVGRIHSPVNAQKTTSTRNRSTSPLISRTGDLSRRAVTPTKNTTVSIKNKTDHSKSPKRIMKTMPSPRALKCCEPKINKPVWPSKKPLTPKR